VKADADAAKLKADAEAKAAEEAKKAADTVVPTTDPS